METEVTTQAATVEEAIDSALEQLGVQQDAVNYEILDEPGKRLFGMGSEREARVRVWIKESYLSALSAGQKAAADVLGPDYDSVVEEALPPELQATTSESLTDEDLDRVADTGVEALREVLDKMGITDSTIEEYEGDEGEIILDVVGSDLGALIGRHGRTLDALQTAVGAVTSKRLGFRHPVIVDVEGYRHRRRQKIEDIARRAADRASRQGAAVRLRPMTAYERRVVHMILRSDSRVITESEGQDPNRQVVVLPK
jgi:spoIIIJ-associated protein